MTVFGMALLYHSAISSAKPDPLRTLIDEVTCKPGIIWKSFVDLIVAKQQLKMEKSWPTLLKSGTFFRDALAQIKGTWGNAKPS